MRHLIAARGLEQAVEVDSAGTGDWHVGNLPDRRATEAARRRGISLSGAARQVTRDDFTSYDLILAMDRQNLRDLQRLAPAGLEHKARLLAEVDVPDPYYGEDDGFEHVLDVVQAACEGLLASLRAEGRL